jgi:hypothetical protein
MLRQSTTRAVRHQYAQNRIRAGYAVRTELTSVATILLR